MALHRRAQTRALGAGALRPVTFATDLTDAQFALVAPLLPAPPRVPAWQTVYRYLRAWGRDGTWQHLHEALRRAVRVAAGPLGGHRRQPECEKHGKRGPCGFDPGKRVVGRKRHILVDTLGLLIATRVEPANLHDQHGAKGLLAGLAPLQPRLAVVYADGAYAGAHLRDWWAAHAGVDRRVVRRPERHRFVVIPKRWIVERTFAWLGRNRRLAKDYEARPQTTEVLMAVGMIGLVLRRLSRRC